MHLLHSAPRQSILNADDLKDSVSMVTASPTLRLLALMVQNDDVFLKDFCAKDGMRQLRSFLIHHTLDMTVVTSLISMFFRISIDNFYPSDSKENDNVKGPFDDFREREINKDKRLGMNIYKYIRINY